MTYAYGRKSEDTKVAIRATAGRSDNDQMKKGQATIVLVVCVVSRLNFIITIQSFPC
jgi:hypothetical protein